MTKNHPLPPVNAQRPDLADKRILVVDDDPAVQRLVSYHLGQLGADVEVCDDGIDAIKVIEASIRQAAYAPPINAVFVDIRMPRLDGHMTAKRLRYAGYEGRIIALSGSCEEESRQLSKDAGCDHFVSKPFKPETLRQAVSGR